jgi:hypothetical protein
MRHVVSVALPVVAVIMQPAMAGAQALGVIAGVVKDAPGRFLRRRRPCGSEDEQQPVEGFALFTAR